MKTQIYKKFERMGNKFPLVWLVALFFIFLILGVNCLLIIDVGYNQEIHDASQTSIYLIVIIILVYTIVFMVGKAYFKEQPKPKKRSKGK